MANFTKPLPEWNDPGIEPPQQLKDEGWRIAQRPPAAYFDWFFYTTYQALKEFQEKYIGVDYVGQLTALTTTIKTSIVAAINELDGDIGDKSTLTTTAKTAIVAAINEVKGAADTNKTNLGDLTALQTAVKTSVVAALNELKGKADTNATNVGDLSTLQTTAKGSAVAAINEVKGKADTNATNTGVLANLTTVIKTSIVEAINEIDAANDQNATDIGDIAGEIGDISALTTADKSTIVAALNELNAKFGGVTKGTFTASGDGVLLAVTIPHGLTGAPTFYHVVEASADAGASDISYIAADATNLTINFKNALPTGTDNIVLVWKAEL